MLLKLCVTFLRVKCYYIRAVRTRSTERGSTPLHYMKTIPRRGNVRKEGKKHIDVHLPPLIPSATLSFLNLLSYFILNPSSLPPCKSSLP